MLLLAPPLAFLLVNFPPARLFIVDTSVTLARRALRGKKIWQAHRSHYYQRLVLRGWGHRRLAVAAHVLMAASAISAIWTAHSPEWQAIPKSIWAGLHLWGIAWVDKQWSDHVEA